ncbi:MAG: cyclic pyranopterin monophosphate synthase MoaC [Actinomycetota bacterium]|nr:cyclic pyranopterin monophosphate synthase MoaC [Actinomycetota bacterium]
MTAESEGKKESNRKALSHLDDKGRAKMVDISSKEMTERTAVAQARIKMKRDTLEIILNAGMEKGDVLAVAQVAGIMAAKRTGQLIPMCHPISITALEMDFEVDELESTITASMTARTRDRTGIEMEALTGATVAALTIYDMCKGVDRSMTITNVQLLEKTGGRSGTYISDEKRG